MAFRQRFAAEWWTASQRTSPARCTADQVRTACWTTSAGEEERQGQAGGCRSCGAGAGGGWDCVVGTSSVNFLVRFCGAFSRQIQKANPRFPPQTTMKIPSRRHPRRMMTDGDTITTDRLTSGDLGPTRTTGSAYILREREHSVDMKSNARFRRCTICGRGLSCRQMPQNQTVLCLANTLMGLPPNARQKDSSFCPVLLDLGTKRHTAMDTPHVICTWSRRRRGVVPISL